MRIGIDARLYKQTGVGRYLRNLIEQLQATDPVNEYIIYLRSQDYDLIKLPNDNWQKRKVDIRWHTIVEQFKLPQILLRDNLDVAHFPYFNVPIFYPGKYLLTIHDLIVDHFDTGRASTLPYPMYFFKRVGYKTSLTLGIKRASWITAISQSTKREISEHYRVSPDKITVTYDALDTQFKYTQKIHKAKNYFQFPYILYVGNAYPHKNLQRLINAFAAIRKSQNIKLVLAGDDNYFYPKMKQHAQKLGLSKEIIFYGEANDEQLINLYTNSLCLVFPSLMEGFGLPSFEAIACGRLPVLSDIPVFREIWGEKIDYFNPKSEKEMAEKIIITIKMPKDEYDKKLLNLAKRLDDFCWKKTTLMTQEIYEQIVKS